MGKVINRLNEFKEMHLLERLYHGTTQKSLALLSSGIDCGRSKKTKDFGKGFYLSSNYSLAASTASKAARRGRSIPVVIEYKIKEAFLDNEYSILTFDEPDEEWLGFILSNKYPASHSTNHFPNHYRSYYDIVYGPLADGRVPRFYAMVDAFDQVNEASETEKERFLKDISEGFSFPEINQFLFRNQNDINDMLVKVEVHYPNRR